MGDRRRIDVEAGSTVIEVKRDLRRERAKREAEDQLAGYVESRTNQTGLRYAGVLTDGTGPTPKGVRGTARPRHTSSEVLVARQ